MKKSWMALVVLIAGCSHAPHGVPVDSRPSPRQPTAAGSTASPDAETAPTPPRHTVGEAATASDRRVTLRRIAADTTAVAAALRRCSGRQLLPDQETTFESTRSLMAQTRGALDRDELWRAESLARKARQLAGSLNCP